MYITKTNTEELFEEVARNLEEQGFTIDKQDHSGPWGVGLSEIRPVKY